MSSTLAFPVTHARALDRSPLGRSPLAARSTCPVRVSSHSALRAARPATDAVLDKEAHNEEQAALRDEMVSGCTECTMPFEAERASALAHAALADHTRATAIARDADESEDGTSKMSLRALVVGAETGKLAQALLENGATHVLVLDHSRLMLDRAAERFERTPGIVGNDAGARFLRADVCEIPAYQGPFDAVVFNDSLASQADPAEALKRAVLLTRPGARVVVSERERESFGFESGTDSGATSGGALDVDALVSDLPLQSVAEDPRLGKTMRGGAASDSDAEDGSMSIERSKHERASDPSCDSVTHTYEVPPLFKLRDAVTLSAPVVEGFGRGSRLMGVPTANLDVEVVAGALAGMRRGVYFGYARLPEDAKHGKWCKCVVNVGARPTFADGEGVTVEVHALRDFGRDFYGERMDVEVLGFLRPEMRFDGLQALVARIMADIGLARGALDDRACRERVDESVGFQADE